MEQQTPQNLPRMMRIFGVSAMALSGAVFLFQGLQGLDQFMRFLSFTGLTMATAMLGIFCAKSLREPKGARSLLALATAAVPVLFAQFGAMVYEVYHQGQSHNIPSMFRFGALEPAQMAVGAAVTLAIGALVSLLGFSILDRQSRGPYLASYMILNTMLILPGRSGLILLLPLFGLAAGLYYLQSRAKALEIWRLTTERLIAVGLLVLPVFIMMVRAAFHQLGLVWLAMAFYLIAIILAFRELTVAKAIVGRESIPATLIATFILALDLTTGLPDGMRMGICLLALHLIVRITHEMGLTEARRSLATLWALGAVSILINAFPLTIVSAMMALCMGALALFEGINFSDRVVFNSGVVLAAAGFGLNIYLAVEHVNFLHWLNLAILGSAGVIMASLLERHHEQIRAKWATIHQNLK